VTRRRCSPVLLLLTLGAAMLGCSDDTGFDRDAITGATVRVRADGCGPRTDLGTGTSIGDGLVVTAAHVVAGADRVALVDGLGEPTAADVVLFDPALDVAALRPIADPSPAVPLRTDPGATGDTGIIALVADDGSVELVEVEVVQRVTILTTDIYRDDDVERPGLRVAVGVERGDSGAMVHLPDGGVGIVWSRSTETAEQAWTVDLPSVLLRPESRRALTTPVSTGPCP
jgi:hypothetical protein